MYSLKLWNFKDDMGQEIGGGVVRREDEQSGKPFGVRKMKWKHKPSGKPPDAEKTKLFLRLLNLIQIMLNYNRQIFIHAHNPHVIQPIPAVKLGFSRQSNPLDFVLRALDT